MRIVWVALLLFCAVGQAQGKEVVVEIFKKQFIPAQITVAQGDTVIWKNIEKRQYHNVWFKQLVPEEPDYFFPGESYQRTFNELGEFPYACGPHPAMVGTVTVVKVLDNN
ncbi:Plastocyanin [Colwellia chukchiensis]|uniref:Plastocyanin n=1 Tax=Colwellia chukchiensis TaxID=641665 RepID=A0A1H7SLI7_9GAMM|nr:plastocyanin/azurin family copper-binding protein [Colwellia chukchiensis]SEL72594.1 Plastocyanin [Colwellia chukchiensis]